MLEYFSKTHGNKKLALIILFFLFVQLLIVMVVTLRHKSIFDGLNGAQYVHAIQKLSKSNPCAAYAIKGCYLISIIEVVFLFVYEYKK